MLFRILLIVIFVYAKNLRIPWSNIFFYSGEHLPVHVHVRKAEGEMKFELGFEKGKLTRIDVRKVKGKKILKPSDISITIDFIKTNAENIVTKWNEFFIFGVKPKLDKITKKK